MKDKFLLRPDIHFMNFGSFGATPKCVLEKYHQLQIEMEADPVDFITNKGLVLLAEARRALAKYIDCGADDVVYVPNPSYAVNTVAKSLQLKPGDEILATNLEYGACDKAWQFNCDKAGAKYIRQHINLPLSSKEQFVEDLFKGLSSKTKMVFISHITSTTALRLPVEEVIAKARSLGLQVFIDGAHTPGHIPLSILDLQPDYYTGACHKWMMTPKGSSFLYVNPALQNSLEPLVVSWGYKALFPSASQFLDHHQMNGTRDYTAYLTIPTAIAFMQENNWLHVAQNCRKMVKDFAPYYFETLATTALAPLSDDFILQMLSAKICTPDPEKLHAIFYEKYNIQIPVMRQDNAVYLRFSINAFNTHEDLFALQKAIIALQKEGMIVG